VFQYVQYTHSHLITQVILLWLCSEVITARVVNSALDVYDRSHIPSCAFGIFCQFKSKENANHDQAFASNL